MLESREASGRFIFVVVFTGALLAIFLQEVLHQYDKLLSPPTTGDDYIIGIEIGRSYNRVAVFRNDSTFEIVADEQGHSKIPTHVAFLESKAPIVGVEAKNGVDGNLSNTIYDICLLLGRNWSNPSLQVEIKHLLYEVVENNNQVSVKVNVNGSDHYFTPEVVLSYQLANLKKIAETYLNQRVNSTIISVPCYFSDIQRQVVRQAAESAGLDVRHINSDSQAAGLAHSIDTMVTPRRKGEYNIPDYFLIYHIEDFESSIVIESVLRGSFSTRALVRSEALGGNYLNNGLLSRPPDDARRIHEEMFVAQIKHVLEIAQLNQSDIKAIVLTGTHNYTQKIQSMLETFFKGRSVLSSKDFAADEAVVYGAALQGHRLSDSYDGTYPSVLDVVPLSLGIEVLGGKFEKVIPRGQIIPTRNELVVTTTMDGQDKIVINVLEGESLLASKNERLGKIEVELGGLLGKKGEAEIEIHFEVDADGFLTVIAIEGGSKRQIMVEMPHGLNLDQYFQAEARVKEAEDHNEEDAALVKNNLLKIQNPGDAGSFHAVLK